jgi:hypothetical protein
MIKNRNGQWEGPGERELNRCIMHQVHTSLKQKEQILNEYIGNSSAARR